MGTCNVSTVVPAARRANSKCIHSYSKTSQSTPPLQVTPKDFAYLKKLGVVRKPANFACSISDDRGDELLYAGKID